MRCRTGTLTASRLNACSVRRRVPHPEPHHRIERHHRLTAVLHRAASATARRREADLPSCSCPLAPSLIAFSTNPCRAASSPIDTSRVACGSPSRARPRLTARPRHRAGQYSGVPFASTADRAHEDHRNFPSGRVAHCVPRAPSSGASSPDAPALACEQRNAQSAPPASLSSSPPGRRRLPDSIRVSPTFTLRGRLLCAGHPSERIASALARARLASIVWRCYRPR